MPKRKQLEAPGTCSEGSKLIKKSPYFTTSQKLQHSDYSKPCKELAKFLLGKLLCRHDGNSVMKGKIVEVEAYPGATDGASHSYKGQTERNKAMFMTAGTAYVYNIYGMYQAKLHKH